MRSNESSSHWQSPKTPAKSLTRRGGFGRAGTCAITIIVVKHSSSAIVKRRIPLFHVAIVIVVVVIGLVIIKAVIKGDFITQFVLIVALSGEVLR